MGNLENISSALSDLFTYKFTTKLNQCYKTQCKSSKACRLSNLLHYSGNNNWAWCRIWVQRMSNTLVLDEGWV